MIVGLIRTISYALAVGMVDPTVVWGQLAQAPSAAPVAAPSGQPVFSTEQIDQMTAPIALYPDDLLAQVLIAATYPIEIVQAERWVSAPDNAALKGDQLAAALENQPWDPSVKSLVPYPQVLKMMSEQLDWTQRLGDAFLAQQADVMASVQRLRKRAEDAGTLKSTEQQTVTTKKEPVAQKETVQKETIVIQPANPQVVYVPSYNPQVVYGGWPYPAYPPPYYPPPPGYYAGGALVSGMAFGLGVASIAALSDCCHSNWGGNNITVNSSRYNEINRNNIRAGRATQMQGNANTWRHDPSHRGGVAYRDPASRQTYQRQGARPTAATREVRGYQGGATGSGATANRTATGAAARGGAGTGQRPIGQPGGRPAGGAAQRPAGGGQVANRQPSAFGGMGNGGQVRAEADRGRMSQQSFRANAAPGGGGMRAAGGARGGGRGGRR